MAFFIQLGDQVEILFRIPVAGRQRQQRVAQARAHIVVRQHQIFHRIDIGHAGHDNTAGVDAQMIVIRDIDFLPFLAEDRHQGGELFLGRAAERPVDKGVVRFFFKQIPGDKAAGVDKVRLEVGVLGDFFIIEGRRRKDVEIFQAAALKQFGNGTLKGDAEIGMRAERGETGAVLRVEQHHADHRIFAAQRGVVGENREAFRFEARNCLDHARIALHHALRNRRQADRFGDNAVFDIAFKHLRKPLHARFVSSVARRHAVGDVEVADDVHRDIDGLLVGLTGKRQAADAALGVAGLQIHQLRRGQRVVRIVKGAQARIQNAFRQRAVRRDREPFLVRVVDEIAVGDRFAQPEIGKEVVGRETLEIFAQRRRQRGFLTGAFAVGKAERTIAVANMHGPDVGNRIKPGGFFNIKAKVGQLLLEARDGVFQCCVFTGNKRLRHGTALSYIVGVKRAMIRTLPPWRYEDEINFYLPLS